MNNYDKEISKLSLGNNHVMIKDLNDNIIYSSDGFDFAEGIEPKNLGDFSYLLKEGKYYQVIKEYSDLEGKKVVIWRLQDVTELFKEIKKIAEEMNKDPLTGVFTKQGFKDKLEEKSDNYCLAILDIDDFKKINDIYGHTVADEALVVIGSFLLDQFRETDIIGRFGGDEFVIACQSSSTEKIAKKIEDVRKKILKLTNNRINITVGLTEYDKKLEYDENLRKADIALYHGKQDGKGKVVIYTQKIEEETNLKNTAINNSSNKDR